MQPMSAARYLTYRKPDWPIGRTECGIVKYEDFAGYTVRLSSGILDFVAFDCVLFVDKQRPADMEIDELFDAVEWLINQTDPWRGPTNTAITGRLAHLARAAFQELRRRSEGLDDES